MLDAKTFQTPMETPTLLSDAQFPAMHVQLEEMHDIAYQKAIGSLMYAVTLGPVLGSK